MRGKCRLQICVVRWLVVQEFSEVQDISVFRGFIVQWVDGVVFVNGYWLQFRVVSGEDSIEEVLVVVVVFWECVFVLGVDRSFFVKFKGEFDFFDFGDIFFMGIGFQFMERIKFKVKIVENFVNLLVGGKVKSFMFFVLGEVSSDDDFFQFVKLKLVKKINFFFFLEDEDDFFIDQKVKKNEIKFSSQQDVILII